MKIAKADQKAETRENMRGGDGAAILHHIVPKENLPGNCRLYSRITLDPGCSIGEHTHTGEAELFYILSGYAEMTDNGKPITLEAGDVCMTGNPGSHSIRNAGTELLEILAVIIQG